MTTGGGGRGILRGDMSNTDAVGTSATGPQAAVESALRLHAAGNLAAAEAAYRGILAAHPEYPPALHLLGVALSQQGNKAEAVSLIARAIERMPAVPDFHANLALALLEHGDPHRAIPSARQAIALQSTHAEAHNILGNALKATGQIEAAVAAYQRTLQLRSDHPDARHNLADAFVRLGRRADADLTIQQSLAFNPRDPKSLVAHGHSLLHRRQFAEAEGHFRQILQSHPNLAEAHDGLATSLMEQSRFAEAAALYRRAVELDPNHPGPHSNLGYALVSLGQVDEGVESYHRALAIRPDLPDTYNNLGNAHLAKLETAKSLEAYNRALYFKPDHTDAHWNRSLLLLLMGDFPQGFFEYEWRWLRFPDQRRSFPQPLWDGSDVAGKTLLLHAEQGLGDTIQFCRLAPIVAGRTRASVLLEVQPELLPLLRSLPVPDGGSVQFIARGQALPPFEFQCPLMSLPHALGLSVETIPAAAPYLAPDPALVERFAALIGPADGRLKVGVVWTGAPIHRRDRERSIPFATLQPLLAREDVRFVSLQKPTPAYPIGPMVDLSPHLSDFAHTAAAVANLDLVISIDTSVAHLAGALGKATWVLLPYSPDWRWLVGRGDSPWYPTMTLYRQPTAGDWESVFRRVGADLDRR